MSRSFTMAGGSQGESQVSHSSSRMGMFQPEVNYVFPKGDKPTSGRILPARDTSMRPEDPAYATSVVPYRDNALDTDPHTNTPGFTSWFAAIKAYRFFGRENASFISPLTLSGTLTPEECADPLADIFTTAKNHADPRYKALTKRPDGSRERSVIPRPDQLFVYNMYLFDPGDNTWKVAVVPTSRKAHLDLKDKLSAYRAPDAPAYDENFPNFLFGDITNPQTGLLVNVTKIATTDGTPSFNGFMIGTASNIIQGTQAQPVDEKILAQRFDLFSDKTLKIPEYKELVDYLVFEGSIPHELIVEACGQVCDIPPVRGATVTAPAAGQPQTQQPAATPPAQQPATPPSMGPQFGQPTPPPAGGQPPAQPYADGPDDKFWLAANGQVVETSGEAVRQQLLQGQNASDIQLMSYDQNGGWKTADQFGFKMVQPQPAAPATPPPPAQPTAPATPAAPATPPAPGNAGGTPAAPAGVQAPPTTTAPSQGSPTAPAGQTPPPPSGDAGNPPAPAAPAGAPAVGSSPASPPAGGSAPADSGNSPLSAEEETRYKELTAKSQANQLNDPGEVAEFVDLMQKRQAG